jgi:hypothetical protein
MDLLKRAVTSAPELMPLDYSCGRSIIVRLYPEFDMLTRETAETLGKFIFNNILCRWGTLSEIITDNSPPFIAALNWLTKKYHVSHICISAYNKQANGLVEHSHHTIRESIVRACAEDISRWPQVTPHVFWADRVTAKKSIGYSPFYLAHRVDPILTSNIFEAT